MPVKSKYRVFARDVPVYTSLHNRYIEIDLDRFLLPNYRVGFFRFINSTGYTHMCAHIDELHEQKALLPPNREEMNAIFYQFCLDKFMVWDPEDDGKTAEEKVKVFEGALEQRYQPKAEIYWANKKNKYTQLDCSSTPDDEDADHPGYLDLYEAFLTGPDHPDYESAKLLLPGVDINKILSRKYGGDVELNNDETVMAKRKRLAEEAILTGPEREAAKRKRNREKKARKAARNALSKADISGDGSAGDFGPQVQAGAHAEAESGDGDEDMDIDMDMDIEDGAGDMQDDFEAAQDDTEVPMDMDDEYETVREPGFGFSIPIRGNRLGDAQ